MNHSTRTGKIARLPPAVREELNKRLHEGEPQELLVRWLNDSPIVQERLAEYFQGQPITQQNVSTWKRGGFLDWQRQEGARGLARDLFAEANIVGEETGGLGLPEKTADLVALMLLRLFRTAGDEVLEGRAGPKQRQQVVEMARELGRLRRADQLWRREGVGPRRGDAFGVPPQGG